MFPGNADGEPVGRPIMFTANVNGQETILPSGGTESSGIFKSREFRFTESALVRRFAWGAVSLTFM